MNPQENKNFKLDDLKKENPFQVPEHYFESLRNQITDRIQEDATVLIASPPRIRNLRPLVVYTSSIAAILIIALLVGKGIHNKLETHPQPAVAASPHSTLNEYDLVAGLDEATLMEGLANNTKQAGDTVANKLNKDKIIDYLVQDNIEISSIIDEF